MFEEDPPDEASDALHPFTTDPSRDVPETLVEAAHREQRERKQFALHLDQVAQAKAEGMTDPFNFDWEPMRERRAAASAAIDLELTFLLSLVRIVQVSKG